MRSARGRRTTYAALLAAAAPLALAAPRAAASAGTSTQLRAPLRFERNLGQSDPAVRFLAAGLGYRLFLTDDEAVLALHRREDAQLRRDVVRLRFVGARPASSDALEPLPGVSHYYVGDRAGWRSDVAHHARVTYRDVYPGIDLTYYGNDGRLEYDFVLAPGADPASIRLRVKGARATLDAATGDLRLRLPGGELRHQAPVVYQDRDGTRHAVEARYVRRGRNEFGVALGAYDRAATLVIDPVLMYSTYLGGTGGNFEQADGIAVTSAGEAVVVGFTPSSDFPRENATQVAHGGDLDAFVTRFQASGSALVYSTFLGGNGGDYARDVALDASRNAYVVGATTSTNFPLLNPFSADLPGEDAFVAKLGPTGGLAFSTYLGGASSDAAYGVAVDSAGQAVVVGETTSTNFPTVGAYQPASGGSMDMFVTRFAADGSTLSASTYLGGSGLDRAYAVALRPGIAATVYVAGQTDSSDFPVVNAYQTDQNAADATLSVLGTSLGTLAYSTYLGGGDSDSALDVAVAVGGVAYVVGTTASQDFPTVNALQGNQPAQDAFLTALAPTAGSVPAFSTYIGGSGADHAHAVAVDRARNVYVAGTTSSSDFPLVNGTQAIQAWDAFVAKFTPDGQRLAYSTALGGAADEAAYALALDPAGSAYVAGLTASANFPTVAPFQVNQDASEDAFVAKLSGFVKGDFDRDARTDLVFRYLPTGHNDVWLLNGTTRVGPPQIVSPAPASLDWQIAGTDDFDGDERNDLVFWNSVTGQVEFWLMNGTTRVGAPVPLTGADPLPVNWRLSATADFNHDGRPDLVWRNFSSQKIVIWTMNGTARVGGIVPTPDQAVDANWEIVATLDFTGDGATDFLWYNPNSGKIVQWVMDDAVVRVTGRFTNPANAGDNNWKVLAAGDYGIGPDGPDAAAPQAGTKDVVWRNATSGRIVVWHMDTAGNRTAGLFLSPDAPAPTPTDWIVAGPR